MAVLLGTKPGTDNGADFEVANFIFACQFTAAATGTVDTISIVLDAANTNSGTISAAVFDDSAGTPNNRIGNTVSITAVSGAGTRTSTPGAAAAVNNGTNYWLAYLSNARFDFDLQNASSGSCKDHNNINAVMPATFGTVAASFTETVRGFAEDAGGGAVLLGDPILYFEQSGPGVDYGPYAFIETIQLPATAAQTFLQDVTATAVVVTASIQKQVNKILSATAVAVTASMQRQTNKIMTATSSVVTASIQKQVNKTLTAASVVVTATLLALKVILKTLTATTVVVTATMQRQVNKLLTATTVAVTASIQKQVNKTLTATTVAVTATLSALKVILKVLTATAVVVTATMQRQVNKVLAPVVAVTGTITKLVTKRLTATAVSVVGQMTATFGAIATFLLGPFDDVFGQGRMGDNPLDDDYSSDPLGKMGDNPQDGSFDP